RVARMRPTSGTVCSWWRVSRASTNSNGPASKVQSSTETLPSMRVHLGSDHAGFELKNHLFNWLTEHGYDVTDEGPKSYVPEDDYPTYCLRTALAVVGDPGSLGFSIGGL